MAHDGALRDARGSDSWGELKALKCEEIRYSRTANRSREFATRDLTLPQVVERLLPRFGGQLEHALDRRNGLAR